MTQPTTTHEITCKHVPNSTLRPFEAQCTCGWYAFSKTREQLEAMCELHQGDYLEAALS